MLYSRSLLVIYFTYSSVRMLIPTLKAYLQEQNPLQSLEFKQDWPWNKQSSGTEQSTRGPSGGGKLAQQEGAF